LAQISTNSTTNVFAVLQYTCQQGLEGINSRIETSVDLAHWNVLNGEANYSGQTILPDGRIQVSYTSSLPASQSGARYFRLRIGL
jgi:hypothetical protein